MGMGGRCPLPAMITLDCRLGLTNSSIFLLFWSLLRHIHKVTLPVMGIFLPSAYLRQGSCQSVSLSTFQPLLRASSSCRMLNLEPVSSVILSSHICSGALWSCLR